MELETRRLLLRPLCPDDAPAIARGAGNLNVSRNLTRVQHPYGLEDAEQFLAFVSSADPQSRICAITFRAAPEELIGIVAYERMAHGGFEFGYWLDESCWGMRIGTEAATALVAQALGQDQLASLEAGYHTDNPRSGRILRRLGFVETSLVQSACLAQGRSVPCQRLKLTREAWLAQSESRAA